MDMFEHNTEMTWRDIVAHFTSWRWQWFCWLTVYWIAFIFDLCLYHFGSFKPASLTAFMNDYTGGAVALFLLVNVSWTFCKLCMKFPGIWYIFLISWWIEN